MRGAFKSAGEINARSVNGLTYMLAVLDEALRMYPPIASNLVREVPRGGGSNCGEVHAGWCKFSLFLPPQVTWVWGSG